MIGFLALLLTNSLGWSCTGDYYTIPNATAQDIDECGQCRLVTNNSGKSILVPTKTAGEWTAFYTNAPTTTGGGVAIGTCATTCTYPLDTTVAPAAAYSLRKLRSAYAGSLLRVRRPNGTELDIGGTGSAPNCTVLDRASMLTFAGTGNLTVARWYDQTVNARHAVQGTAGSQPRIVTNGALETKFGTAVIRFDGTTFIPGVYLGINGTGGSWSYSMVVATTTSVNGGTNDGNGTYYMDRTTATNNLTGLKASGGKLVLQKRTDGGASLGGVATTTNISTTAIQAIFASRTYSTSYNVFLNNTGEGTLAETDGALTPPVPNIGRHVSNTSASNFGILELIFWGSTLTSGERTTVYQDQKTGFGF
jgi:hypothetical protein